jgi:hypothetical protein
MSTTVPKTGPQAFVFKYRVERPEIWTWYWWAWRQPHGLWSYWIVVGAAVASASYFIRTAERPGTPSDVLASLVIAFAMCAFFILHPQLMYKGRERVLQVSATGIDTSIGTMSAHRNWKDVSLIVDRGEYIAAVVAGGIPFGVFWLRTLNGNAFIIPNRAFGNASERVAFLQQARSWHAANVLRFPRFSRSRYYG